MATDIKLPAWQHADMSDDEEIEAPNYLRAWRKYRRLTLHQLGVAAGTDKTQIFKLEKGERKLTVDWLNRLAPALGVPSARDLMSPPPGSAPGMVFSAPPVSVPVTKEAAPSVDTSPWRNEASREGAPTLVTLRELPLDLAVMGIGHGGNGLGDFSFNGKIAEFTRRPPVLNGVRDAFAVYVVGDSMYPRYEPGEILYVHPGRPPVQGAYVLVELHGETDDNFDGPALIKRFISHSSEKLVLEQINPPKRITISADQVKHVYVILRSDELFRS